MAGEPHKIWNKDVVYVVWLDSQNRLCIKITAKETDPFSFFSFASNLSFCVFVLCLPCHLKMASSAQPEEGWQLVDPDSVFSEDEMGED